MPYTIQKNGEKHCVHKQMEDGSVGEKLKCYDDEAEAKGYLKALYANVPDASKAETFTYEYENTNAAVKAVGDWELDVRGNPYGPDTDGQFFDENTDLISGGEVPVVYYHGIKEGEKNISFTDKPILIGKAINPERRHDGVWWRVVLDKTKKEAGRVWEAAKQGIAVASSGAIDYLSRLEIDGKLKPYDKRIPGRISVWHMGELSLWENDGNHRGPAHPYAVALPALKAIYEQAGITLPEIADETENDEQESRKAAKIARKNLQKRARLLMTTFDK